MQTLKDLTADEIRYVIGNILRSRRYGAISSRLGKMRNTLVGAIFSDCELFSNLELTQSVYDRLGPDGRKFPLDEKQVKSQVIASVTELSDRVIGNLQILSNTDVGALINEIQQTFVSPVSVKSLLQTITDLYDA